MNPCTALARVLVDELVRGGVREAVLAPGSRSAPLAFALADADAGGRLRLHVRIDERSAAFLALGLAKASRTPVPVVTTSGTATANLHPAVLEASYAGVPLLLLTADRPPELRGTGANQTVDQVTLYGGAVRLFTDIGAPERRPGQVAYWRALVCRALAAATGELPGPVHLNLGLREPLVPDGDDDWVEPVDGRPDGVPWTVQVPGTPTTVPDDLPARTVLVLGDATAPVSAAAVRLAAARRPAGRRRAVGLRRRRWRGRARRRAGAGAVRARPGSRRRAADAEPRGRPAGRGHAGRRSVRRRPVVGPRALGRPGAARGRVGGRPSKLSASSAGRPRCPTSAS